MDSLTELEQIGERIGEIIGEVLQGNLPDDILRRFAELANSPEARYLIDSFPSNFEIFDSPTDPDKSLGFTLVNDNTWLPTPLYEARNRQRRNVARKNESAVVWTR